MPGWDYLYFFLKNKYETIPGIAIQLNMTAMGSNLLWINGIKAR